MDSLLDRLESLKDKVVSNSNDYYRAYGICTNVGVNRLPHHIIREWPKFSGYDAFPVPHVMGVVEGYHHINNKWSGEYGELRMELLNFIIDYLKKNGDVML